MKRIIILLFLYINILSYSSNESYKQFTLYITNRTYYHKDNKVIGISSKNIDVNDNLYCLLHEYGHYISHLLVGNEESKKEFNNLINLYRDKYKNRIFRFPLDYTTKELKDYRKSPIQDTINAITKGRIKYIFGHDSSYWNDYNIYQEVFANLYVLYVVGDQKQINELNKIFPGLMNAYAKMLNSNSLKFVN